MDERPYHVKPNLMRISCKHGLADESLAWSKSKVPFIVPELNDVFRKKNEPPIFIYKGMTLTLKLLSRSNDSTKMPFLPSIRPSVIEVRITHKIPRGNLTAAYANIL